MRDEKIEIMRVSIERLRFWILVLAGVLVGGILLFLGLGRWQVRRIARDLPQKLGISIQQSTTGFTFSKSEGGHTLFTLHAAKTVQLKGGGRTQLHDVSITMYGPDGQETDRIYGNDFDYDPGTGVVRANGAVQIDLQAPAGSGPSATGASEDEDARNTVHVKTADLVFNQKTGLAETPARLEFRVAEAAGDATGATFDSRSGMLILDKDVDFQSSMNGSPLVVRAGHAQFDRANRLLHLSQTSTDFGATQSSSDRATVHFRPDGSAFLVDAQGHVTVRSDTEKLVAEQGHADLDQKNQPQQVVLSGGVVYSSADAVRTMHGTAAEATLLLGPQTTVRHAQLRHAVSLVDEEKPAPEPRGEAKAAANSYRSTTRNVDASQVDIDFTSTPDRRSEARQILAVGGAQLNIHTFYANTPPQQTAVAGDQLLVTIKDGVAVSNLRGVGHTKLSMISPSGLRQTSTGDTLQMTFAPPSGAKKPARSARAASQPEQAAQLESTVQQGNVVLTQQTAPNGNIPSSESTATAQRATYDAGTQLIHLYGDPHLRTPDGDLAAAVIQFERTNGNAAATGGVKATYRPAAGQATVSFGGSDPVHVVADHARLDHQTDLAVFYGTEGADARLWQGADSISAPVLELSRTEQTLSAHGGASSEAVRAVLTSVGSAPASGGSAITSVGSGVFGKSVSQAKGQPSLTRVTSRTLLYSDPKNQALFRGDVKVQAPSGTVRAKEMEVYFTAGSNPASGSAAVSRARSQAEPANAVSAKGGQGKQVERIVARGDVQLEQPDRHGTGNQLVYTAQNGNYELTGTVSAPPQIVDQVHGTVTGSSLIFNDRDGSVMVSGGQSKAVTETRTAK